MVISDWVMGTLGNNSEQGFVTGAMRTSCVPGLVFGTPETMEISDCSLGHLETVVIRD